MHEHLMHDLLANLPVSLTKSIRPLTIQRGKMALRRIAIVGAGFTPTQPFIREEFIPGIGMNLADIIAMGDLPLLDAFNDMLGGFATNAIDYDFTSADVDAK